MRMVSHGSIVGVVNGLTTVMILDQTMGSEFWKRVVNPYPYQRLLICDHGRKPPEFASGGFYLYLRDAWENYEYTGYSVFDFIVYRSILGTSMHFSKEFSVDIHRMLSLSQYDVIKRIVTPSFTMTRLMGTEGGQLVILHIVSGGLPKSRHPNQEAARLQTLSARERLKNYQDLIVRVYETFGEPIHLLDISKQEFNILQSFQPLRRDASRIHYLPKTTFFPHMSKECIDICDYLWEWNPALRASVENGIRVKCLWEYPVNTDDSILGIVPLVASLRSSRGASSRIRVVYSEIDSDMTTHIHDSNLSLLMARQPELAVEYIRVKEHW